MNRGKIFQAWITKYALSDGIFQVEVEECGDKMVKENAPRWPGTLAQYFHGNDWHTSRTEAVKRAEDMRKRKIASLRKKLDQLEGMKF